MELDAVRQAHEKNNREKINEIEGLKKTIESLKAEIERLKREASEGMGELEKQLRQRIEQFEKD